MAKSSGAGERKGKLPKELDDIFLEVEYIDPADSECEECKCSFGVHLKTCSKFKPPTVAR